MNRVSEPHDSLGDWENAVAIPNEKWNEFTLIRSYSPRLITKTRLLVILTPSFAGLWVNSEDSKKIQNFGSSYLYLYVEDYIMCVSQYIGSSYIYPKL